MKRGRSQIIPPVNMKKISRSLIPSFSLINAHLNARLESLFIDVTNLMYFKLFFWNDSPLLQKNEMSTTKQIGELIHQYIERSESRYRIKCGTSSHFFFIAD